MKFPDLVTALRFDPVTEAALFRTDERLTFDTDATLATFDVLKLLRATVYDAGKFCEAFETAYAQADLLGIDRALYALYLITVLMSERDAAYSAHGISQEVYLATASDIRVWADEYMHLTGRPGFDRLGWLCHHISGTLFRVGRIQFEIPCAAGQFGEAGGSYMLEVHIPKDGPLDFDACRKSFADAPGFFAALGITATGFSCHSWVLWPGLRELLPPDSNLVRFQKFFPMLTAVDDGGQTIERVFGFEYVGKPVTPEFIDSLPADTSLRRIAIARLREGKAFGAGQGVAPVDTAEHAI